MKKIISVLLLALTLSLFSSCIIVGTNDIEYTLTLKNALPRKSSNDIFDWYVIDDNNDKYVLDDNEVNIPSGGNSSSIDLPSGSYYIIFSFEDTTDRTRSHIFYKTEKIYLYSDKVFTLTDSVLYECDIIRS